MVQNTLSKDSLDLTKDERTLLTRLIEMGVRKIKSKAMPEGVSYEGLDELIEQHGIRNLDHLLESLAEKGFLDLEEQEPYIFCPNCNATHVYSRYSCPKCRSTEVEHIKIIEHPFCGYTGLRRKFISGPSLICPNCSTNFGSLDEDPPGDRSRGDYVILGSSFQCENCGSRFDRPNIFHICQKCGKVFNYMTGTYKKLRDYEIPENVLKSMQMRQKYNILLIEDNLDDAKIISRYFEKYGDNFNLVHTVSGEEGLKLIEENFYDVIFLDLKLPGIDGLRLLEEIKAREIRTPVVMLTGSDDRTTAVEAMKLGASDYIVKSNQEYKKLPSMAKNMVEK